MMKTWSEELNINYRKLRDRLGKLGWSAERALGEDNGLTH